MRGTQGDAAGARGVPLSARSPTGERRITPWAAAGVGFLATAVVAVAAFVGLSSCAASEPNVPAPSGSLGVVTVDDARRAVSALCEIVAQEGTDRDAANAAFYDRAHQTLHVIAAAVEVRDRAAAAALQQDKGVVEEDLAREQLPRSFADDVRTLVSGTRDALARVGIDVPPCPS